MSALILVAWTVRQTVPPGRPVHTTARQVWRCVDNAPRHKDLPGSLLFVAAAHDAVELWLLGVMGTPPHLLGGGPDRGQLWGRNAAGDVCKLALPPYYLTEERGPSGWLIDLVAGWRSGRSTGGDPTVCIASRLGPAAAWQPL